MKFDHTVKFNGKYYLTGEDVPINEPAKAETKVEEPVVEEVEEEQIAEDVKKSKGGRPRKKA